MYILEFKVYLKLFVKENKVIDPIMQQQSKPYTHRAHKIHLV